MNVQVASWVSAREADQLAEFKFPPSLAHSQPLSKILSDISFLQSYRLNSAIRLGSLALIDNQSRSRSRSSQNSKSWRNQWETSLLYFRKGYDNSQILKKKKKWRAPNIYILKALGIFFKLILRSSIHSLAINDNSFAVPDFRRYIAQKHYLPGCTVL